LTGDAYLAPIQTIASARRQRAAYSSVDLNRLWQEVWEW